MTTRTTSGAVPSLEVLAIEVARNEQECRDRHARNTAATNEVKELAEGHHDRILVFGGEDGKNGRIGTMATELAELKEWKGNVNSFVLKLAIAALVSSGIGGGIAVAIAKAIGG